MSNYYHPKKTKNTYDPLRHGGNGGFFKEPFRLSRSKIDLFLNCPRCFYLDRRLGIPQPPGFPFSLNSAVDKLLKKEFDIHRAKKRPHPLMAVYGIEALPLDHEKIDEWRDSLGGGIRYLHPPTNFLITGGVDDVWVNRQGEFHIVDYKATAKEAEVSLDADWQIGYKRQMEIYQWLFRQNGFKVSPTGYFVYCNGETDKEAFDGRLEFSIKIIPYVGDDSWVEGTIKAAAECLADDNLPKSGEDCDFCRYRESASAVERESGLVT